MPYNSESIPCRSKECTAADRDADRNLSLRILLLEALLENYRAWSQVRFRKLKKLMIHGSNAIEVNDYLKVDAVDGFRLGCILAHLPQTVEKLVIDISLVDENAFDEQDIMAAMIFSFPQLTVLFIKGPSFQPELRVIPPGLSVHVFKHLRCCQKQTFILCECCENLLSLKGCCHTTRDMLKRYNGR